METTGLLKYNYTITVNMENLIDTIIGKLSEHIDDCDWETDGEYLIINATDTARFKHWHCNATLESPAEDETDLLNSIADADVEQLVLDALHEIKRIKTDVEIDEDYDFSPNEPDEDAIYDQWRDRQLEDE